MFHLFFKVIIRFLTSSAHKGHVLLSLFNFDYGDIRSGDDAGLKNHQFEANQLFTDICIHLCISDNFSYNMWPKLRLLHWLWK